MEKNNIYPKLVQGVYTDKVKDDLYLYYNRMGYGGIVVVDQELQNIINDFKNGLSFDECVLKHNLNKQEAQKMINLLIEKEILYLDEHKKSKKMWPKKFDYWFHITNECTLDCSYCYIHKCGGKMDFSTAKIAIDKAIQTCRENKYEEFVVRFAGGEPLMAFEMLKNIISYIHSIKGNIKTKFVVLTNGTIVNEEIINYLIKEDIGIAISLDGIEQFNDKNRYFPNGKGSYFCVMNNIQTLILSGIKPSILLTLNQDNLEGLPQFTRKMIEMGLTFRFSLERNIDTGSPDILKDENKLINTVLRCINIMNEEIEKGNVNFKFRLGDVYFNKPVKRSCGAVSCSCAIGHDGKIGTCGMGLSKPFMNIFETEDILTALHKKQEEFLNYTVYDVEECNKCTWRSSCANACPLQTKATFGTYKHVSPYCNFYKKVIPEVVKMYALHIYKSNNY